MVEFVHKYEIKWLWNIDKVPFAILGTEFWSAKCKIQLKRLLISMQTVTNIVDHIIVDQIWIVAPCSKCEPYGIENTKRGYYVTFGDYICKSGGLIDSSPALGVVYEVSVWSPWWSCAISATVLGAIWRRRGAKERRAGLVYTDVWWM